MAGGPLAPAHVAKERSEQYQGRVTPYVIITCIVAAVGGSLFGYDVGISGGVTSMGEFLSKFFHTVREQGPSAREQLLQVQQSRPCSVHLIVVSSRSGSFRSGIPCYKETRPSCKHNLWRDEFSNWGCSQRLGCQPCYASIRTYHAWRWHRLWESVPLYLSEMAPAKLRGGLNMLFQLATTLGIFTANMINSATDRIHPWGWRLSLGLAAAPAFLMTVGGVLLPETPNSLIERGLQRQGREVLEKIRGTKNVDAEFEDIVDASKQANAIQHPFRNILKRRRRPELVMAIFMPMFQILTGINSILFYAPVLFQSMGFKGNASLYSSALTGAVLASSTLVSMAVVDRWGRRVLLISGGIQMILCQIIAAVILGLKFGNDKELSRDFSIIVVTMICLFVAAFGWSWGPLGWTVPSEIFPLETRSAGQSITVAVNLLFTFIIAQSFLSMLCTLKFGIFLFFAGWIAVMTIFVYIFLPETKGVPLEEMVLLWRKHWFWKRIVREYEEADDDETRECI
ncbi:UNVERIFIED_CONTAM: Sugar transport protein 7 [Sesamum latifolium]|uniref:Sugar transport protein 7 n=1 Tax=Sesamum latifolium TaxID=2727402 RepID=A0AAW2VEU3_9LAMI